MAKGAEKLCPYIGKKQISPQEARTLVSEGKATFVGLEKVEYLNFSFVEQLKGLKEIGRPLIVNIRSIEEAPFLDLPAMYHFLSHLEVVDYIVDKKEEQDFTLKHVGENFFSNTFFVDGILGSITGERIQNRKSFFRKSYKKSKIRSTKFIPLHNLQQVIFNYQKQGKNVALVSGVFDVLHEGHIKFLEKAAKASNILIVLVNSDYSTSLQAKNKIGDRPIHALEERIAVLGALEFIDHITAFDSENILSILADFTNIVYVKTEKDKDREFIIQEMEVVDKNQGSNLIVPFLEAGDGSELSSSEIIAESRKRPSTDSMIPTDEEWSPTALKRLYGIVAKIKKSEKFIQKLTGLKRMLYKRYTKSKNDRVRLELRAVQKIILLAREIIEEFPVRRGYYSYTTPYLLGKLLHFDIRIVPLQYKKPGLPYSIVNALQLINGRTVFFDLGSGIITDPFVFEEHYWKVMPHHTHYLAKDVKTSFAMRIYAYAVKVHYQALSLRMLLEEYYSERTKSQTNLGEIETIAKKIWETLEEAPYKISRINQQYPVKKNFSWPGIIAHGGVAVLAPKDPQAENSRAGIRQALEAGVDVVEIDVNACKDGWIVAHDQKLELITTSNGQLTEITEEEARKIRLKSKTGKPSRESLSTLSEALAGISAFLRNDPREIYVKIDIKYTKPNLEKKLVHIIKNCGIPLQKILITSQLVSFNRRIHYLCPTLPFEFNTVETNLFLLAYGLMDESILPNLYIEYIASYAPRLNAKTISLAQFALSSWEKRISKFLINKLHQMGFRVQVWVASTIEEYYEDALLGADYVLMQNPKLTHDVLNVKNSQISLFYT